MPSATTSRVVNRLIGGLPRADRARLLQHCEPVDLHFGAILCEAEAPMRHAYFPLAGFISLVMPVDDYPPLEMGMIGNEGMLGATLALGVDAVPLRGVVQGSGTALRLGTASLRREMRASPALLRTLNRYVYVSMSQLAQVAACTRFHEIEARLARWLLMTHDRAHADQFHLTHEFLSDMLGVRRSGITVAAGALQRRGLLRYRRGEITVLDRHGLEAAACECYEALKDDYARLLG